MNIQLISTRITAAAALAAGLLAAPTGVLAQAGHDHGGGISQAQAPAAPSGHTKAYKEAMDRMHGPMMQGVQDADPDVAFVKGMIPHHQGAIEMAKVVLAHGKDEQVRKWAADVIREQEREMNEMRAWLQKRGK
jgi:uncharacterized protein (DUF305 family)